jgi:hypothetical protein
MERNSNLSTSFKQYGNGSYSFRVGLKSILPFTEKVTNHCCWFCTCQEVYLLAFEGRLWFGALQSSSDQAASKQLEA